MTRGKADRAAALNDQGLAMRTRFEQTSKLDDLNHAVRAGRAAVRLTPRDDRDRGLHVSTLANTLHTRYEQTGRRRDLDEAVRYAREAVQATSSVDADHAMYLSNLGNALRARFERAGQEADLREAVRIGRRATRLAGEDDPNRSMCQANLALALRVRFEWTGSQRYLSEAIKALRAAVDRTGHDDPARAAWLSDLGAALRTRYEWCGTVKDLDEAIHAGAEAVRGATADPDIAMYLSNLALAMLDRHERSGTDHDLAEAIVLLREAARLTSPGHPDRAIYLSNLGLALYTRYDRTARPEDLDESIEAGREAVSATPTGHPDAALYRANLSAALWSRYERAGTRVHLEEAIEVARAAVRMTSADHVSAEVCLANLALVLHARYEATGSEEDLDEAIRAGRRAVARLPTDHPKRSDYLSNLSLTLRARFERLGIRRDIDDAIRAARQAVAAVGRDYPWGPAYLTNLSNALQARFDQLGRPEDLDEAITAGRAAVRDSPAGHPDRAMYHSNLGSALQTRYERGHERDDLAAAIRAGRSAVRGVPVGHPRRTTYLSDLAAALAMRFAAMGRRHDLREALELVDAAVKATADGHPDQSVYLLNMAEILRHADNLAEAVATARRAAGNVAAGAAVRIEAAYRWGRWAWEIGDREEAAKGYAAAVSLLPVLAWHGLDRGSQEDSLGRWAGLVSQAATCAVAAGLPRRAVELAELGRSVLWTHLLRLRGELGDLEDDHPALAARLRQIRDRLDQPALWSAAVSMRAPTARSALGMLAESDQNWDQQRSLAREWDTLLAQVRALPGRQDFLQSRSFDDLRLAARQGPVVMLNASVMGCHALVITAEAAEPQVIGLPALTHADALRRVGDLLAGTGTGHDGFDLTDTLDWLWHVAAEPVLAALGFVREPADGRPLPRLWWCPIGPLAFLPIHAAGIPASGTDSVPERVVSSYTSTLHALWRANPPVPDRPIRQLTVALPQTPGGSALPGVRREVAAIAERLPKPHQVRQLLGVDANAENVLAELPHYQWVHLACHAVQHPTSPASSGFQLWDWRRSPLKISDLADLHLREADLAFLSACQTSTGDIRLYDESIHLAAAMQAIGFRHVIAAQWPVVDTVSTRLSDHVYAGLVHAGKADSANAAVALHEAVRDLRSRFPHAPWTWASYVHFGP
jgi:tetratricopeptide (TPR) repeat protein